MRRHALLLALFAAACLLAAPWRAGAQNTSAIPMQGAPKVAAAHARAPMQPVAWSSLSPAQQRMLAPVQGQWNQLPSTRQHGLANQSLHWATLPPQHQQQIRERLARWAAMTPEQRRQLRENARAFRDLTPEERARVSEAFQKFQSLPPAERRALRERWQAMPPEQRKRWVMEHPHRPVPAHPPAHRGH